MKRTNADRTITYLNRTLTAQEWSTEVGIPYAILIQRLDKLAWPVEKALTTPVKKYKKRKSPAEVERESLRKYIEKNTIIFKH